MRPGVLTLERFDLAADEPEADPAMADAPLMDAPPINPPRADGMLAGEAGTPDPVAELTAELEDERAALRDAVAGLDDRLGALRAEVTGQAAGAVAEVAAELLPTLIEEGFASELAAATVRLIEAGAMADTELRLAPAQHDRVIEGLAALRPPLPVTIRPDAGLAPGEARLAWPEGGARFDATDLAGRARDMLTERIEALSRGTNDDG